jgi:cytochrome c553
LPRRARFAQRLSGVTRSSRRQNADWPEVALQGYRRGTQPPHDGRCRHVCRTANIADIAAYFSTYEGEPASGKSSASAVDIEAGKRAAVACQQCHGQAGVADAKQWPTLAGQHESYLEQALKQYQTGQRADALMGPMVKPLDSATIAQLAAYFSAQPFLHGTEPGTGYFLDAPRPAKNRDMFDFSSTCQQVARR